MMMITKKKLVKISFSFKKSSKFRSGCQQIIIDDQLSIDDDDVSGGNDSGGGDDESSSGSDFAGNYISNLFVAINITNTKRWLCWSWNLRRGRRLRRRKRYRRGKGSINLKLFFQFFSNHYSNFSRYQISKENESSTTCDADEGMSFKRTFQARNNFQWLKQRTAFGIWQIAMIVKFLYTSEFNFQAKSRILDGFSSDFFCCILNVNNQIVWM